jgi:hypothetical protein
MKRKLLLLLLITFTTVSAKYYSSLSESDFLSFEEIKFLLTEMKPAIKSVDKLGVLMNTAFSYQGHEDSLGVQYDKESQRGFL